MYWHIDTDIISLIVLCVLYVYNRTVTRRNAPTLRDKRFMRCLDAGIGITIIDISASVIMEVPTPPFLYHLLMTLYFIAIQGGMVEWVLYALTIIFQNDAKLRRRISRIVLYVYAVYIVFNALNPWTGAVYSLSPEGVYTRGPFFMMMVLLYAAYVMVLFVMVIVHRKKIAKGYPWFVLILSPVIFAAGIAAQLLNPGWLMILPSYMICLLLTSQFLQNIRMRDSSLLVQKLSKAAATDPLTGIFNRAGAEDFLRAANINDEGANCLVAMIDIDDLKVINDTFGHAQGDRAIKTIAEKLNEYFLGDVMVSRFGGDEYLVYKIGDVNETQTHMLLRGLLDRMADIRVGENDEYNVHCSVGATLGVVGLDDFTQLFAQADAALYHVKRSSKNNYAVYRPEMNADQRPERDLTERSVS